MRFRRLVFLLLCPSLTVSAPAALAAQNTWTGIGAISGTVMYMDTAAIVRDGTIRKVWVKSYDLEPRSIVSGADTLTFDTVIGLNVFDCHHATRAVTTVSYMLGADTVLAIAATHDRPQPLKPRSFFAAVYSDVCGRSAVAPDSSAVRAKRFER